jgi:hypothetical protein
MVLDGQPIRTVVGGNYMVDPAAHDPFAGGLLLKKLFSGPQDLTMSDTGNDKGRKMWEELGALCSDLYSMHWVRFLRPTRFLVNMASEKAQLRPLATILRPLSAVLDGLVRLVGRTEFDVRSPAGRSGELQTTVMLEALPDFRRGLCLYPEYTPQTLDWLITEAEKKEQYGPLQRVVVRDEKNRVAGWFLYYPNRGGTAQVLQLAGRPETFGIVLDQLFAHAYARGSLAVTGRIVPGFMKEFSRRLCLFYHRSNYFLAYSRNKNILNAIHAGKAFLTRLEGEWWTRLQGDQFN